ncbi:Na+/H+ antiporter NhaC [Bacteriovoracaceae bacterium]|nr:Na+/H+ antiporter NhaC [Bacteriovoracaceae bacterium]
MSKKTPSLIVSLIPLLSLITLLAINVKVFADDASYGPNQIALLLSSVIAAFLGIFHLKLSYKQIEKKIVDSIGLAMQANLILLTVGALIGVWILSGIVPTMVFYGMEMINPSIFLVVSCLICSVVSLATGSSWSTGGTVGIALIGVGTAIGIPVEMVAGSVISGSYFGDKMSPLSDTTNLAPATAGSDLFSHIRHMMFSTFPTYTITLVIFFVIGLNYGGENFDAESVSLLSSTIKENFYIGPVLFILPGLVLLMVMKKVPALPALVVGTILGALFVVIFQQKLLLNLMGGEFTLIGAYKVILNASFSGFSFESGNPMVDKLFNRGGMSGMLNTIWLIIMAMSFGGVMEGTGMLGKLADTVLKMVRGTASLVGATIGSALVFNVTASDQFLAIVVTSKMFKNAYKKLGLDPVNLSRAVEDSATVTSVLVPWNTCAAYFASVLGVSTFAYLPYCYFNLISPLMSFLLAATGFSMIKARETIQQHAQEQAAPVS